MTARILDGKRLARELEGEIAAGAAEFAASHGRSPRLAAVLVGGDPASAVYVRSKERACGRSGIESRVIRLPAETNSGELLELVTRLGDDAAVDGILVQLPLPPHLDARPILDAVAPAKDVDAFHPENVGLLAQGRPRFVPCTPQGVMELLAREGISTAGRRAAVVGRSDIVGKPLAMLLAAKGADATVTLCHSRTSDLAEEIRRADLVIAAVGRPACITGDMLAPGAVVIDVGINRTDAGLVGDVDFASASEVASAITPVPGGVGPLTISCLLRNTLAAARAGAAGNALRR